MEQTCKDVDTISVTETYIFYRNTVLLRQKYGIQSLNYLSLKPFTITYWAVM